MIKRLKLFHIFLFILAGIFISNAFCFATEVSHEYGPLDWSFQEKPVPETHWSPWLPPAQVGFRAKLGFLISGGADYYQNTHKIDFPL